MNSDKCIYVYARVGTATIKIQNIFITPPTKVASSLCKVNSCFMPRRPLMYFLSSWISLRFLGFHINGIKLCVFFYVWIFSFSVMFLRFVHVVDRFSTLFLFVLLIKIPSY